MCKRVYLTAKEAEMEMQEAKEDAEDVLDNYLKPFDMVMDMYYPNNMTKEEFDKFLEETGYDKKSELIRE